MYIRQINFLFIVLVTELLILQPAKAQETRCLAPVDQFEPNKQLTENQIQVKAQRAEIQQDTIALFAGNVDINNSKAQITADKARIDKQKTELNASGNVSYRDKSMQVKSSDVKLNTESGSLKMSDTTYQLTQFSGRGSASQIDISQSEGVTLSDVSYTTCPEGAEDWRIEASSISIEEGELWGESINTVFYVKDIPVLYLPYFVFPVSDQRQSGFLFPEIANSTSTGVSYEQPFYWNIAPNFDATISPRAMSNRGVQLKTEFRYLTEQHTGQVNLEYLPDDRELGGNQDRYFYRYFHTGKLSENWLLNVDFNGLSDDNYIVDLGSDYYNRADTHLYRTFSLNYYAENLDFSMSFRDFEIIGDHPTNYRALPEMKLNYVSDLTAGLEFRLNSELAYFDNQMVDQPRATRFHFAPSLALPLRAQWGEFLAEATLLNTYYRQDNIENTELEKEVNRTLGQGRIFGALYFERQANWFGESMQQTLEPKIQYLYTSFKEQNTIGQYDTTTLLNNFNGLFRGQEFTGLDRISDNNQVTVGLTSRLLDKNNREQFKLSLGQIFYLEDNRLLAATKDDDRSALASELDWQIGSKWSTRSELQLSTKTDKVERSSVSFTYQLSEDKLLQLSHRFVRNLSGEMIDQFGVTASWPLSRDWHWVGRWYKDLSTQRTIESYTGVQYESCCWSISLIAQRHLSNRFDTIGLQSTEEFESSINLKFKFKFSGGEGRTGRREMLEDGLFGYRQSYLIN